MQTSRKFSLVTQYLHLISLVSLNFSLYCFNLADINSLEHCPISSKFFVCPTSKCMLLEKVAYTGWQISIVASKNKVLLAPNTTYYGFYLKKHLEIWYIMHVISIVLFIVLQ